MLISDLALEMEVHEATREVIIELTCRSLVEGEKQALVEVRQLDAEGAVLELDPEHLAGTGIYSSPRFGYFAYLATERGNPVVTTVRIPISVDTRRLVVRGHPWGGAEPVTVIGEPHVIVIKEDDDSVFLTAPGGKGSVPVPLDEFRATYPVQGGQAYEITTQVTGRAKSQALFLVSFYDADGDLLMPSGSLPITSDHGEYFYARPEEQDCQTKRVVTPRRATTMRLTARQWAGPEVSVASRPVVESLADGRMTDAEVAAWIDSIPADGRVVLVYTTAGAIGSGSLLLRSNRLALEYAKRGWHVVFFPFSELKEDESEQPAERVLQLGRRRFRIAFDRLIKRQGPNNVLLCSTNTDVRMVGILDRVRHARWRTVYEIRDDMEEFNRVGYAKWFDPALELRFSERADVLVAVSPRLAEKIQTITGRSVTLVPNAAPDELIDATGYLRTLDAWERRRRARKVGYIGHLTESWFDWQMLLQAVQGLDVQVEIIGHGMPSGVALPGNVEYLGPMPHQECLPYAEEWSAGLIPFKISPLTYGVDPNKIYEYVAMGLRTVTAPMGQVWSTPSTWVYEDADGLRAGVLDAVDRVMSQDELDSLARYSEESRWSQRGEQMTKILGGSYE